MGRKIHRLYNKIICSVLNNPFFLYRYVLKHIFQKKHFLPFDSKVEVGVSRTLIKAHDKLFMNYKLERQRQHSHSKIIFNNIFFDTFKINSIERYAGRIGNNQKLLEVYIKVRTLDDHLIKKKDGNIRIHLKGEEFLIYHRLAGIFSTFRYQNRADIRESANQDFVYFILRLVISNYELN